MRKSGRPCKGYTPVADASNEALRATRRLGLGIWKRWSSYRRGSLIKTKMRSA